jgi:hypothetical protein
VCDGATDKVNKAIRDKSRKFSFRERMVWHHVKKHTLDFLYSEATIKMINYLSMLMQFFLVVKSYKGKPSPFEI